VPGVLIQRSWWSRFAAVEDPAGLRQTDDDAALRTRLVTRHGILAERVASPGLDLLFLELDLGEVLRGVDERRQLKRNS
jgi:hypothetical protein